MSLRRWFLLEAVLVGLGCLQVAQRHAILLNGYAVGARMERVHAQETNLAWLRNDVTGLASPTHLARVARDRRLTLVAWSTLPAARVQGEAAAQPLIRLAADDPTDD